MAEVKRFILLMDDDKQVCDIGNLFLNRFGYEVVCAPDGEQALAAYSQAMKNSTPFSVVLLDLNVPGGMGGQETMKKLLEIDPACCGVVTSGDPTDPVFVQCRDHGFSGALAKPFNLEVFTQLLETLCP